MTWQAIIRIGDRARRLVGMRSHDGWDDGCILEHTTDTENSLVVVQFCVICAK